MRGFFFLIALWLIIVPSAAQVAVTGAGTGTPGNVFTIQPLLSWASAASGTVSNSVEDYAALTGNAASSAFYGATWASRVSVMPTAGTLSGFRVSAPNTTITTGSYVICITTASATCGTITCTISSAANNCADTTDTMTVTAGELLAIGITPTGTPTAITGPIEVTMKLKSTVGNESTILCGNMGLVAAQATAINYQACQGNTGGVVTTEYSESILIPPGGAGTIDSLQVYLNGVAGAGAYYTVDIFHNGASTTLSCSVSGASATTCSVAGGTNAITVAAGDTISMATCPSENGATYAAWCAAAGTAAPTARDVSVGLRYIPNVPGYSIVAMTLPAVTAASTSPVYEPLNGIGNAATGNTDLNNIPGNFVFSNLIVGVCPGPGTGVTRAFSTYVSGSAVAPTATIPSGTAACPTLSTAQDVSDIFGTTTGQTVSTSSVLNTTSGAASANVIKTSMMVH